MRGSIPALIKNKKKVLDKLNQKCYNIHVRLRKQDSIATNPTATSWMLQVAINIDGLTSR
jgi:hypothetical protein